MVLVEQAHERSIGKQSISGARSSICKESPPDGGQPKRVSYRPTSTSTPGRPLSTSSPGRGSLYAYLHTRRAAPFDRIAITLDGRVGGPQRQHLEYLHS